MTTTTQFYDFDATMKNQQAKSSDEDEDEDDGDGDSDGDRGGDGHGHGEVRGWNFRVFQNTQIYLMFIPWFVLGLFTPIARWMKL
mgnify:CR=1 FL=1